jgi:XXXCH domain-containing protein
MATKKTKIELAANITEIRDILTRLGSALESGRLDLTEDPVDVSDFTALKLNLKRDEQGCRVSVRIKHAKHQQDHGDKAESESPSGRPSYKTLKKRMKKPWKDLLHTASIGRLPDPALLEEFLDECELMISYPDEGEEYYAAFKACMQDVHSAAASKDPEVFAQALARMDAVKKQCHDEYK